LLDPSLDPLGDLQFGHQGGKVRFAISLAHGKLDGALWLAPIEKMPVQKKNLLSLVAG
jgi:hypothetical protein